MKVLVPGGAGYIGSVTTEMLCDEGHEVTVFDNLERGYQPAVDPRAKYVQGDLRVKEDIKSALLASRPEAVIHFAAYIEVGQSMKEPMPFFENNVTGSLNLMSAMVEAGCRKLIFSSTCATYGTPERIPMDETLPQSWFRPGALSNKAFNARLSSLANARKVRLSPLIPCGHTAGPFTTARRRNGMCSIEPYNERRPNNASLKEPRGACQEAKF